MAGFGGAAPPAGEDDEDGSFLTGLLDSLMQEDSLELDQSMTSDAYDALADFTSAPLVIPVNPDWSTMPAWVLGDGLPPQEVSGSLGSLTHPKLPAIAFQ